CREKARRLPFWLSPSRHSLPCAGQLFWLPEAKAASMRLPGQHRTGLASFEGGGAAARVRRLMKTFVRMMLCGFLAALCASCSLAASTFVIKGVVTDASGKPVR